MQLRGLVLLASSSVISSATAVTITNQSDANTLPDTVTDGIEISSTYSGNLVLPTVVNVVGNVTYEGKDLVDFYAPFLSYVVGSMNFTGSFQNISVPVIKQIAQDLILETTNTSFNCTPFQALKDSGGVGGQFNCTV